MFNGLHYNSVSTYMKERFGCRVVKLSLDAGLTCPNRDGACGTGGCSFCSSDGAGTFATSAEPDKIREGIESQIQNLSRKWKEDCRYIAYFQSNTNTYASPERLRILWDRALEAEGVVGLAIATRPDCLGPDILELLEEYNKRTFLWVELGLQTEKDETALAFNRGYKTEVFTEAMMNLSELGIKCVVHLILGLPGESREDMLRSAAFVSGFRPFGVKLHMLHLMKDTEMCRSWQQSPFPIMSMEEYISLVCDILELLPPEVTVHRLTGDAPKDSLVAPLWTVNKHLILNEIQKEFKRRGTCQGSHCSGRH